MVFGDTVQRLAQLRFAEGDPLHPPGVRMAAARAWHRDIVAGACHTAAMSIADPSESEVARHCALLTAAVRSNPDATFLRIGSSGALHAVRWTRYAGSWEVPSPRCGHAPADYAVLAVSAVRAAEATCADCLGSIRAGGGNDAHAAGVLPTQPALFEIQAAA